MAKEKEYKENSKLLHSSLIKKKSKFPLILVFIVLIGFSVLGAYNAIETKTTYFD